MVSGARPAGGGGEAAAGGDDMRAPMPGCWRDLGAGGAAVARGDVLVVLEAMKMEHALLAPRDGTVAEVLVAAGEQVAEGAKDHDNRARERGKD